MIPSQDAIMRRCIIIFKSGFFFNLFPETDYGLYSDFIMTFLRVSSHSIDAFARIKPVLLPLTLLLEIMK